jgi:hypothetical protein
MKISIWHHNADRKPDESGYYLAYKSYSMGDDSTNAGYYYYSKMEGTWRDSSLSSAHYANVYYWTDADPEKWVDEDPPLTKRKASTAAKSNPAVEIAWNNIQEAIRKYELIKALVGNGNEHSD